MFRPGETLPALGRRWGMIPRSTLIAVLVGVEFALAGAMVTAVRGDGSTWGTLAPSQAPDRSYRFRADAATTVTVAIGYADLAIDTAPGSQITVSFGSHGFSFGHLAPLSASEAGNDVRVTSTDPDGVGFMGNDKRLVHITVPPATHVNVQYAGDMTVAGLRGHASFNSDNGKIDVSDFQGALEATSSDGHVSLTDSVFSTLHVSSANGHVELRRVSADHIDASSDNGRVVGSGLRLRDGTVSSENGHVSLGFASGSDTTVTAATSDGSINLAGFGVASQTTHGGDDDDDGAAKTVRIGAGNGQLDVHSSNGNIDLTQEG